jgi:hypothetical protein
MHTEFVYLAGSFIVGSIMMWWFNTNLPIHVVQILKLAGFNKSKPEFYSSDTPIEFWTKVDFDEWKMKQLPVWLDELLACPGCLSMHISFWVALFITLLAKHDALFFFLAWGGWPYISNYYLVKLQKLQKH